MNQLLSLQSLSTVRHQVSFLRERTCEKSTLIRGSRQNVSNDLDGRRDKSWRNIIVKVCALFSFLLKSIRVNVVSAFDCKSNNPNSVSSGAHWISHRTQYLIIKTQTPDIKSICIR